MRVLSVWVAYYVGTMRWDEWDAIGTGHNSKYRGAVGKTGHLWGWMGSFGTGLRAMERGEGEGGRASCCQCNVGVRFSLPLLPFSCRRRSMSFSRTCWCHGYYTVLQYSLYRKDTLQKIAHVHIFSNLFLNYDFKHYLLLISPLEQTLNSYTKCKQTQISTSFPYWEFTSLGYDCMDPRDVQYTAQKEHASLKPGWRAYLHGYDRI